MTMQVIEHIELASAASSITFSSISGDFTELYLVISARSDRSGAVDDPLRISFNGSSSNFTRRVLFGSGASAATQSASDNYLRIDLPAASSTSNVFCNASVTIPNYASSNYKSLSIDGVNENNTTNSYYQMIQATLWSDTSAITSISLTPLVGTNLVANSSATLFGITAGSDGTTAVS